MRQTYNETFLSLALFASIAGAQPKPCKKPGSDRWPIKTSVSGRSLRPVDTLSFGEMSSLEAPASVAALGAKARFQSRRLPDTVGANLHEGSVVRLVGYFRLVAQDDGDCDYHIQISRTPFAADIVIVEIAAPDYVPSTLQAREAAARQWVRAQLLHDKAPSGAGNVMQHPPYVYVDGQLFFDQHHHPGCDGRGKKGMPAATCWEVHPITAIGFAAPVH